MKDKIKLGDMIVAIYVLAIFVFENETYSTLFSAIQLVFFAYIAWMLITEKTIPLNVASIWLLGVAFIALTIGLMHYNANVASSTLSVIKNCIKCLGIVLYLRRKKNPNFLIAAIGLSGIACGFALLSRFLGSTINYENIKYATNSRMGADIAGGNVNVVAMNMCFALSSWLYVVRNAKKNVLRKVAYICLAFVVVTSLLTGTRKILIFYVIAFLIAYSDLKLRYRLIAVVGIVGLYIALMNVEPLYYLVGHKLDFFGTSMAYKMYDASDEERLRLALGAVELFWEHPLGIGFGGVFTHLGLYAHNNFAEVLASLGIVGFPFYYGIYVYGLAISYKYRHEPVCRYCLYVIVALMVLEMGQITCIYPIIYIFFPIMAYETSKHISEKCRHRFY